MPMTGRVYAFYIATLFAGAAAVVLASSVLAVRGRDHFAAIRAGHGSSWYQDMGGASVTEIQDQDIFFHDIGASIANLKKADVVIVGSSLVAFAIDGQTAQEELTEKDGLSFYNMSFVGIASGEFTRRIAKKYAIHPRLWIINADDGSPAGGFFSNDVQRYFSSDVKPIAAMQHTRLAAYKDVVRRNMRWRGEQLFKAAFNSAALENPKRVNIPQFYRDADSGNYDFKSFPRYLAVDNPSVLITRPADCHTTTQAIQMARSFMQDMEGAVILTLIPNTYYCEQQAHEIAKALGIEAVLTGSLQYSSWDGGGHLDHRGAVKFSSDLFGALKHSATYQRMAAERRSQRERRSGQAATVD
jgi:hypothetical protein